MSGAVTTSYQVALPGEFGPAFLATFAALGIHHVSTASVFLLRVPEQRGIAEVAAMLQDRGLQILDIRRVARHAPAPPTRYSSAPGDDAAPADRKRGPTRKATRESGVG